MLVPSLSHLITIETKTRSQAPNLLEPSRNGVGNGRFTGASVSTQPEYARGVVLIAIDPGSNLVKDFSAGTLQTGFLDV